MEFLKPRSCQTLKEVRFFIFRWGAQVALAEILVHRICIERTGWLLGRNPSWSIAELIGVALNLSHRAETINYLDRQSLPALLETGLLPLTSRDGAGLYRGIAPLDATFPKDSPPNCWPRYKGIPQEPSKYLDDLIRGFEAVADIFASADSARKFCREIVSSSRAERKRSRFSSAERGIRTYPARIARTASHDFAITTSRRLAQKCCASSANRTVGFAEGARSPWGAICQSLSGDEGTAAISRKQFAAAGRSTQAIVVAITASCLVRSASSSPLKRRIKLFGERLQEIG